MKRIFTSACLLPLGALLLAATSLSAATAPINIPEGTVLPARLNSTLSSKNAKPGQAVTARIMQAVLLPSGAKIREGATLVGHVVGVSPASSTAGGSVSLRFDTLRAAHQLIPIATHLRAIAAFVEVEDAQIPLAGPDRGTPSSAWTTIQIGGDVVYRGGGSVEDAFGRVGRPAGNGVLSTLKANREGGCRGAVAADGVEQSLWVFSADACGAYGLRGLTIAHTGRTEPRGEITLRSGNGDVIIASGAGLLLRVDASGTSSAS